MHSYIFQVRTTPLSDNALLDSHNTKEGESVFLDESYNPTDDTIDCTEK